jgi:hypothetical protein
MAFEKVQALKYFDATPTPQIMLLDRKTCDSIIKEVRPKRQSFAFLSCSVWSVGSTSERKWFEPATMAQRLLTMVLELVWNRRWLTKLFG